MVKKVEKAEEAKKVKKTAKKEVKEPKGVKKPKKAVKKEEKDNKKAFTKTAKEKMRASFIEKRGNLSVSKESIKESLSKEKKGAAELLMTKTKGEPLAVKVTGLEPVKNPKGGFTMMPVAMHMGYKIIIPRTEFLEGIGDDEVSERRMNGSIGSTVDIIATKFVPLQGKDSPDKKIITVASRKKAMDTLRERWWNGTNVIKGKEVPLIREGDIVENARVVYVVKGGITVEVFGIESFVPVIEVSYDRVENCRSLYRAGDKVSVKIKEIAPDRKSFVCSIKEGSRDKRVDLFPLHVIGGMYHGVVRFVDSSLEKGDAPAAYVTLDSGLQVRCTLPKVVTPDIGDSVMVAIRKKDPESLKIWGDIVHVDIQIGGLEKK